MALKKRRFADDGWAIWIDGDDVSTVYLNNWLNPKGKSFIDIAVRIRGVKSSASLNIFIPYAVDKNDVEDISLKFQNSNVLRATFGAACIIDFKKNKCTSEIAYNAKTIDLVHLSGFDFDLKALADGSLFTVDLTKLLSYLDNDEAYFMFRLPHKSINTVLKPKANVFNLFRRLRDLITSPVVTEKYGYSVRINESRLLPEEINRLGVFHRQKLKKSVITISINEGYQINDSACYRIRRLEEDLYKDYAPSEFKTENVITYQWNQTRETNLKGHFNYYFDISRNSVRKWSMFIYLVILVIFGAMGNALWDVIKLITGLLSVF